MYYHLITKDGLKQKDLSIEEIEKILREEEVNYNNARIYSSEKKLNEVYEDYKEELFEEGEDIGFENVNIQKLISVAERKNNFQNSSYKFFLDIKNPSGKINFMNFLNKTFIIWLMLISSIVKWILVNRYYLAGEMEINRLTSIEKLLDTGILLIVILVFLGDKYFKKEYFVICILANIVTNLLAYISIKLVTKLLIFISARSEIMLLILLLIPIIKAVIIQLVYNYAREKSYREYKDFNTIHINTNRIAKLF